MNFLKNLDLYKAIVLGSLLLLPVALGFVYWVDGEVERANLAIRAARRNKGELEQIGALQQQLETIAHNVKSRDESEKPSLYFERRIMASVEDNSLKASDFVIGDEKPDPIRKLKAVDQTIALNFRRDGKELPLPRAFIYAVLKNCESGGAQVWKLRQLEARHTADVEIGRVRSAPPKTIDDLWLVKKMVFARREPDRRR